MNVKTKYDPGNRLYSSDARQEAWIKSIDIRIEAAFGQAPGEGKADVKIIYNIDFFDKDHPKYSSDSCGGESRVFERKALSQNQLTKDFPLLYTSEG